MLLALSKPGFFLFCLACLLGSSMLLGQASIGIDFATEDGPGKKWMVRVVTANNMTTEATVLKVYLQEAWTAHHLDAQAISGHQQVLDAHTLIFRPFLPFSEGVTYVAIYPGLSPTFFTIPARDYTATKVVAIYPSSDTLPENTLKMYLHFSAPMSVKKSKDYVYLTNAMGDTIVQPFLDLDPELWNEDRSRLTLWFDPGRLKRDLVPNREMGAPLEKGQHYTLHINPQWTDAQGHSLAQSVTKSFFVTTADRTQPEPARWSLVAPAAHSKEALHLQFGEMLDEALSRHSIVVLDEKGEQVNGDILLGAYQQSWHFVPWDPWKKGPYQVRVDAILEDLAGNNLNRPFDRDLALNPGEVPDTPFYWLPFLVK
ncbi:MAG: hypothetical protein R2828_13010 [Saprospiraceae bacterium]